MAEKKSWWFPSPSPLQLAIPRASNSMISRRPSKAIESVTRQEIARFWKRKRMQEEEHLLAAQKAAARIRARALTEEDYKRFEELLTDTIRSSDDKKKGEGEEKAGCGDNKKEVTLGIKDWWISSKYAYLNQPAIKSMEAATTKRATSTYNQQKIIFICSSPTLLQSTTTFPLGVF